MYPAIKAASPKSGIASIISGKIIDGPGGTDGAEALCIYHSMGASRTLLLVGQQLRGTPMGFSIRVCIEELVLDTCIYGII